MPTGAVSDVLREFCLLDQALPGYLRPLNDDHVVAGFAFTVKSAPNVKISGEMSFRTEMLEAMQPDSFVMWDTSDDMKATLWGGVMTATAVGKGVKAACIDGGIRDTRQINEKNFPLFRKKLQFIKFTPDELAAFRKAGGQPVWDEWVVKRDAQGIPGREVLDFLFKQAASPKS